MIAQLNGAPTLRLLRMIRECSDDPSKPLAVKLLAGGLEISRGSGQQLSTEEMAHVRGVLAANVVERI